MQTIYFLLQKEFLQIFRDKVMLIVIFAVPVIQLVVLSYAATFELTNTPFHLVDFNQSATSRDLVQSFEATGYFTLTGRSYDVDKGIDQILSNEAQMVLVIPPDFEKKVQSGQPAQVQILINSVNSSTAGLIQSYSGAILAGFNQSINGAFQKVSLSNKGTHIQVTAANWYNSTLEYTIYMVPGILIMLVTLIGLVLSVLNIVREKEIGTIEQLNVTPIKKYQFIAGKLIPIWIIAMGILTLGLVVAYFWFEVPFRGNIALIYGVAAIYLLVIQGIGLFVSTKAHTQQQAMFINFFLIMVFMLTGGIFTPINSMSIWAQKVTLLNPIAYFTEIIRMVLLKGAGWADIQTMVGVLAFMAAILLPVTIYTYRKRTT